MKRAARSSTASRSRRKTSAEAAPAPAPSRPEEDSAVVPVHEVNVDPLEGKLSVVLGILFVITALFPRSLKQLATLALGGGLLYRGMTRHCSVYQALGVDTKKQPLLGR